MAKWCFFTSHDVTAVRNKFEEIWIAAGRPREASLLGGDHHVDGKVDLYFNPGATKIAFELIAQCGAVECPEPDVFRLSLLVGNLPSAQKNN